MNLMTFVHFAWIGGRNTLNVRIIVTSLQHATHIHLNGMSVI
jgi:hypothetical protein